MDSRDVSFIFSRWIGTECTLIDRVIISEIRIFLRDDYFKPNWFKNISDTIVVKT